MKAIKTIERKCLFCGKTFSVKYKSTRTKFCGLSCSSSHHNLSRKKIYPLSECVRCGKSFEVRRKESSGKYCSRECSDKTNKQPAIKWLEKDCKSCGNNFKFRAESDFKRRKTCSKKCAVELKKVYGKNHPLYKEKILMNCELCGKIKEVHTCKVNEFRFCSRRCLGTFMSKNQPRISSIELLMKKQFDGANIEYEQQFLVDYFITDFAFPEEKLIVECDGNYWHNLPKQKSKDERKDAYLKSKGWQVLRFWESEINENPENCLNKVLAHLKINPKLFL